MTTISLPALPSNSTWRRLWWGMVQVPWRGLGLYTPQALLAMPASYASSQFAAHQNVFPSPFNIMLGIAFEWVYLGTLAVAGAQAKNTWYVVVNGVAVITSIIYVTLHAAERYGLLQSLTSPAWLLVFALIHGIPLAGLNFVYGLLIHHHLRAVAQAEEDAKTRYKCPVCNDGFPTAAHRNGHMKAHSER